MTILSFGRGKQRSGRSFDLQKWIDTSAIVSGGHKGRPLKEQRRTRSISGWGFIKAAGKN
jgi:hypothetical protein